MSAEVNWKSISFFNCLHQSFKQGIPLVFGMFGIFVSLATGHRRHWISPGCQLLARYWPPKAHSLCAIHHTDGCWYHLLSWLPLFTSSGGSRTLWLLSAFPAPYRCRGTLTRLKQKATFRNFAQCITAACSPKLLIGWWCNRTFPNPGELILMTIWAVWLLMFIGLEACQGWWHMPKVTGGGACELLTEDAAALHKL